VVNSVTVVEVHARLVDTRTGLLLWDGTGTERYDSSDSNDDPYDDSSNKSFLDGLIDDLIDTTVDQVFNTATDAAHDMCPEANRILFEKEHRSLPYGPYHPKYGQTEKCSSGRRTNSIHQAGPVARQPCRRRSFAVVRMRNE
jgi:hypothetical protein